MKPRLNDLPIPTHQLCERSYTFPSKVFALFILEEESFVTVEETGILRLWQRIENEYKIV